MKSQTYDHDFLRWTEEQSVLLRSGRFAELDYEHILEELEEMGKEQKVALQSLFRQIIIHLLKLELSLAVDPRAKWIEEVTEFRDQAQTRIEETPSLNHHAPELFDKAWKQARRAAGKSFEAYCETVDISNDCPYSMEQVLNTDFIPGISAQHAHKP